MKSLVSKLGAITLMFSNFALSQEVQVVPTVEDMSIVQIKSELSKEIAVRTLRAMVLVDSLEAGVQSYFYEEIPLFLSQWDLTADLAGLGGGSTGSALGAAAGFGSANLLIMVWDNVEHFLKINRSFESNLRMAGTYGSIGIGFMGIGSSAGFIGGYKYTHAQVLLERNIAKNFPGFDAGTETIIEFADKFFELDPLAKEKIRKTVAELRVKDLYDQAQGLSPKKFDVREILFASKAIPRDQIESVERILSVIQAKALNEQVEKSTLAEADSEKLKTPWIDLNNKTLKAIEDWSRMLKIGLDIQIGRYKRSLENEQDLDDDAIQKRVDEKFGLLNRSLSELKDLLAARRIL